MANNEKQPDTGSQSKIVSEIVGYLKNYPFLLISVAGLVVFIGALPLLEGEKLKAFMPLIYIFLIGPILFQFFLVNKKSVGRKPVSAAGKSGNTPVLAAEAHVVTTQQHFSRKAIASLVLIVLNVLAFGELLDKDAHLGAIVVLGIPALLLGFSALGDAQHGTVTGKGWAIAATALSVLMILASLGGMSGDGNSTPAPAPVPAAPYTPDKQVVTPPLPEPYPQNYQESQPKVARVCVTQYGTCPMMVALPVGSSCNCSGQYGVFPGIAQ